MNTISEYLKWRGDITFEQVPFNEVDAYIFAKIGSPDLTGIVSPDKNGILLKNAYNQYYGRKDINPDYMGRFNSPVLSKNLRRLIRTERFGNLVLSDFISIVDSSLLEQISALTVTLPDETVLVTFRGTDDTIVGWKESVLMAFSNTITAQQDALEYLNRVADTHPGPLVIIGHSKGGNLSVYSSVNAPKQVRDRIVKIYNFDGPGFYEEFWNQPAAVEIKDRILNYMSQYAMVGTLLYNSGITIICSSYRPGVYAHEAMFWEVMGPQFIHEKSSGAFSRTYGQIMNTKVANMTYEEKVQLINDLFGILTSTGAETITDLSHLSAEQRYRILKKMNSTESIRRFGKDLIDLLFPEKSKINAIIKRFRHNDENQE